jgi:hypothetical protein
MGCGHRDAQVAPPVRVGRIRPDLTARLVRVVREALVLVQKSLQRGDPGIRWPH